MDISYTYNHYCVEFQVVAGICTWKSDDVPMLYVSQANCEEIVDKEDCDIYVNSRNNWILNSHLKAKIYVFIIRSHIFF